METTLYRADNLKLGFTGRVVLSQYGMYVEVYGNDGKVILSNEITTVQQGTEYLKGWGIGGCV